MLNIEKYREKIAELYEKNNLPCSIYRVRSRGGQCVYNACTECVKKSLEWLCEEYKEPILDDIEKEYLSAVIKPFRNVIKWISKNPYENNFEYEYIDFKYIENNGYQIMTFPLFKKGTMYKGMRLGKEYTLEELGL